MASLESTLALSALLYPFVVAATFILPSCLFGNVWCKPFLELGKGMMGKGMMGKEP